MRGWIVDLYPGNPGEMVVWLKSENGETRRFVDKWTPSIFVASDSVSDLKLLPQRNEVAPHIELWRFASKYEQITDQERSEVLELKVRNAKRVEELARAIERIAPFNYRIYNADVKPAQTYLYEHDLFPLAYCEVSESGQRLDWKLLDDVWSYHYQLPSLSSTTIEVAVQKQGKIARYTDPIRSIKVGSHDEEIIFESGSEEEKILRLIRTIREIDPDLIFTDGGDTFIFPYLIKRAQANGMAERLSLDRDATTLRLPMKAGRSYFSYGKILFKPSPVKLYGRIHLDTSSSFAFTESGLDGLYELTRVCRMPLHTSSRASIGKALSSLQFYHATKRDLLIPWKPILAEHFKDRLTLLVADRGGFIFEPKSGLHETIAELDFSSLYPNIMLKKNLSAETVRCPCCHDSKNRIPELGWNICEKKGIVPTAIEIIVKKRLRYKQLKKDATEEERERYDSREIAFKWLGVTTFGYLGFNNAKFGRIDAHIGVCAWDREVLIEATRVAERKGFEVIHGIVDSLWLRRERAGEEDYEELRDEIEVETGFEMSFKGIYKWICFLPSKVTPAIPVLNAYFGVYRKGEPKFRGIEARRHDTPPIFSRCQLEILHLLSRADSINEAKEMIPECIAVVRNYARAILDHEVPIEETVFTRNISKKPDEYVNNSLEACVAKQLAREGVELHAGESVKYVITNYYSNSEKRATPLDFVDESTVYDAKRYVELLAEVCSTILKPFDQRLRAKTLQQVSENECFFEA